jgi:hypothetical protein
MLLIRLRLPFKRLYNLYMTLKRTFRIILSLLLVIVFLVACIVFTTLALLGGWMHTYNAFTSKTLVAEIGVSQLKEDENGQFIDVTYKPVQQQSALAALFASAPSNNLPAAEQSFKIYGDTVHIGGPIVKFYDHLVLFNFKTIYKVGKIYGRYNLDNELEISRKVPASFDLNGGIDETWQTVNDNIDKWPYNMFFQTTEISTPGIFASKAAGQRTYNLYMTTTGFLWELKK